jgi:flagellar hook assembly protein FlgD
VALVNNLLRPRTGTTTAITIKTFNVGRITARLLTIDGRSVRTLFDTDNMPLGTLNLTWDGRDAGGSPVASGLYILHVTGQALDARAKIIVVR